MVTRTILAAACIAAATTASAQTPIEYSAEARFQLDGLDAKPVGNSFDNGVVNALPDERRRPVRT
jgi:uncharacterized protein involved in exopolysaccharide biosynthesis